MKFKLMKTKIKISGKCKFCDAPASAVHYSRPVCSEHYFMLKKQARAKFELQKIKRRLQE